jgi:small-conductance mechanosensitive channel
VRQAVAAYRAARAPAAVQRGAINTLAATIVLVLAIGVAWWLRRWLERLLTQSAAFKNVSLFIGVVFSLGSSAAISNIIAGYMMTYRRAFKVGDRIKVGDTIGDVVEMRLQVTHLRSIKNEEIVVPNSHILTSEVLNYGSLAGAQGLILHTQVGIGYETPWRQVEAMLIVAADRTLESLREPRPFVLVKALADFAVIYELNVYSRHVHGMYELHAELHRHILDVFNEHGVQIMTPAYVADPLDPKVVPQQGWYAAPAACPPTDGAVSVSVGAPTAEKTPPSLRT